MKHWYMVAYWNDIDDIAGRRVLADDTKDAERIAAEKAPGYRTYAAEPVRLRNADRAALVKVGVDPDIAEYLTDMGAPPVEIGSDGRIYIDWAYNCGTTPEELNDHRDDLNLD